MNITDVNLGALTSGHIKSCGCLQKRAARINIKKYFNVYKEVNLVDDTNTSSIKRKKLLNNNKTGVTGVIYNATNNNYIAYISFKKKKYCMRIFGNKEYAIEARKKAEEELYYYSR